MSNNIDVIDQLLSDAPHFRYNEGRCLVAPSPDLQEKIKDRFSRIIQEEQGEAAVRGSRKAGAKKGGRKAAKSENVDALIANMLRIRHKTAMGLNDGLIIPGSYYPLGTPPRVVRSAALNRAPLSGTVRVIVVLVNFSNKKMTTAHTKKHFEDLFFSTGVLPNGSVKEYFTEVTNGKISIAGEVAGPFTLSNTMAHYANGESGLSDAQPNARTMALEAAQLSNPTVNFAPYDNDGNGFVDAFIVIHAGSGAEETGSVNDIWSHKWVLPNEFNADGTKIYGYLTVPEDSRIGVCCHELGHLLFGFPDLYDTDGSSEGVGNWCLMGGGSWNGSGDIPAHPSAWCKANQGWVSVVVQSTNANVTIPDVKSSNTVYRLWKNGSGGNEYFLVENRQRAKYDQKLPGDGLLIWHIDESISGNSNEIHPKVKLLQADGSGDLESGTNRGDTGDPYPGSSNNKSFTNASNPSSKSYAGTNTCVAVTNISGSGATMTARLSVKCAVVKQKDFKEFQEKHFINEKFAFKELEKPNIDKSVGMDKFTDKFTEKFTEGGFGGGGFGGGGFGGGFGGGGMRPGPQPPYFGDPRAGVEPFIGSNLRPDLSTGALTNEEDIAEMQTQLEIGSAETKRVFDSKLPEV